MTPEEALVDRAQLLTLTAPEMTVLVGGLRVLGANVGDAEARRPHQQAGNADATTSSSTCSTWARNGSRPAPTAIEGRDRKTEAVKWTATRVDLIFGSHSQLRALAEVYACADCEGEVREGLRRGVDQGDERRPLRSRLISRF